MFFYFFFLCIKFKKKFDENNNVFNVDVKDEKIDVEMIKLYYK